MSSNWINFVKQYASYHGISYRDALREAGPAYRKLSGGGPSSTQIHKFYEREKKINRSRGGNFDSSSIVRSQRGANQPYLQPHLPDKYYKIGYELGGMIGGAQNNKGALAALLSGLDARINIK
jgi:hypothetical protein